LLKKKDSPGTKPFVDALLDLFASYFYKELDMQLNIFNIEYLKNLLQGFTSIDNIRSQIWIPFFLNINKMKEIKILWEKSGKPLEWIKQIISNGIFFFL